MNCRFCGNILNIVFVDLLNSPPSNSFLIVEKLDVPEIYYPLKLYLCEKCFLVQIDEYKKSIEIFNNDYAYYSSYSDSWLKHCQNYVNMMVKRFNYDANSKVIEIASNDGYLLQYFEQLGVKTLGIEPSANVAYEAQKKGIETVVDFFGERLAKKLYKENIKADLLIGNNVFAHVPDINDFTTGMKIILNEKGTITLEFPHLMQLIEKNQFDTIYHEHFSYYSFFTVSSILRNSGLEVFDVEKLPTHGGSLRIFAKHKDDVSKEISSRVGALLNEEEGKGMKNIHYYEHFSKAVGKVKYDFVGFLIEQKKLGKSICAYGAAAKGNTLLNFCGIKNDLIEFVVDASIYKQGKFLPGSHIPVVNEGSLAKLKPDYIIIFPWNIKDEIIVQLNYVREWGSKFVIPIPTLEII